jgi:hypothetical protein
VLTRSSPGHDSSQAARLSINNASAWGGGAGLWMNRCYDASVYRGISFWGRGSPRSISVNVNTPMMTSPTADTPWGQCSGECVPPTATVNLTENWTQFTLNWSEFSPVPDRSRLAGLNINVGLTQSGSPENIELVFDDVEFIQ